MQGQLGEKHGTAHLGGEFGPLVQAQTALVADLDPVVEKADQPEEDDGHDGEIARARELDLGAEMADGVPHDHRRRRWRSLPWWACRP